MVKVAGADAATVQGARGWIVAELMGGSLSRITFVDELSSILEGRESPSVLAVDIPIGHEDRDGEAGGGRRQADGAARSQLASRSATVFSTPPIDLFELEDQPAASRAADARGVIAPSAQVWGLKDRILEVQALVQAHDGDRQAHVVHEVHPEVSFRVMSVEEGRLPADLAPKASWDGLFERVALLEQAGLAPPREIGQAGRARAHDVVDAVAAAWTAHRIATGEAITFPADPPTDPVLERPVAIHA